ncbi:Transaldolase [Streptomyces sp. cf124]|nr:Transaldolase [Streptomyces sp. cf124]
MYAVEPVPFNSAAPSCDCLAHVRYRRCRARWYGCGSLSVPREWITSGNLAELIANRHVVGVTASPAIFQVVIPGGIGGEDKMADLAIRGEGAVRVMTTADVREAADILRLVHDCTGGRDGWVSVDVDPRFADGTEALPHESCDW